MDLTWSEKNSENTSSAQRLQSAHLDLLRDEFATQPDDALETESLSSTLSSIVDTRITDPFQDSRDSPASQLFSGQRKCESTIDSVYCKSPALADTDPLHTSMQLIQAVIRGDLKEVRDLLDAGFDIETVEPENGRTGLIFAALLSRAEILLLLLD